MLSGFRFIYRGNENFERESSTPSGNGVAIKPSYKGKGNDSLSFFPSFRMSMLYFTKTWKNKNWKNCKDMVNYILRQK